MVQTSAASLITNMKNMLSRLEQTKPPRRFNQHIFTGPRLFKSAHLQPEGLNLLCNSIWLWQNSKRQQKPCLSSFACPIKQQASYRWDSLTTTARDKPMPLCPAARQGEKSQRTHTHRRTNSFTHTKKCRPPVQDFACDNLN